MALEGIRDFIANCCFLVAIFVAFKFYTDDTPTVEFIKALVKKQGATEIVNIYDRFEESGYHGTSKIILYNYRAFEIIKEVEQNGKIIHQLVHGEVRCYPELESWNPFDTDPQENYCQYHELRNFGALLSPP